MSNKNKATRAVTLAVLLALSPAVVAMHYLPLVKEARAGNHYAASKIILAALSGNAMAQFYAGLLRDYGWGVRQNYAKALDWYRKAAAHGNANAENNIGTDYADGHGVPQNYAKAIAHFREAAKLGSVPAENNMGAAYYNGLGVPKSYVMAAHWYNKAAVLGNAKAAYYLGLAYYEISLRPNDWQYVSDANIWFVAAMNKHYPGARRWHEKMVSKMQDLVAADVAGK